jgi:hypothetical protein
MGSHSGRFFRNERDEAGLEVSSVLKRQEDTMQLRHIRPGSLDWQDAIAGDIDKEFERLTPEEIDHLRKLSNDRLKAGKEKQLARTEVQ